MNLVRHLQRQASTRPAAPALVEGVGRKRRVCTFAALDARSASVAAQLRRSGLHPGDTVLVAVPFSTELYVVLAALFRAGLVAMVPDPSAGRDRLGESCRLAAPDGFVGPPKAHLLRLLLPEVRRIPHAFTTGWCPLPGTTRLRCASGTASVAAEPRDDAAPALLTFTSGSTGPPKAVVRTHGLLQHQYHALRRTLDLQPGQVDFTTLPIFALANLAAGVTSVLPAADLHAEFDVGAVVDQIQTERARSEGGGLHRLAASPSFAARLLDAGRGDTLAPFERIDLGGAPVPPRLLHELRRNASSEDAARVAVYGSTEAEPIAHLPAGALRPEDVDATRAGKGLLVGSPVDAVEVRILPDRWGTSIGPFSTSDFRHECLPPNAPGEIVVRGPHVVDGYLDGRGDAGTKFDVAGARWHRTGDAGRLDAEGRLWLLGRCSAKVEDARGRCYPLCVTAAARTLGGVRQAALVRHRTHRVLVVETADCAAEAALESSIRARLAWALLDAVHFTETLPTDRRHHAKVDYPALRRLLTEEYPGPA